jgi:hypothetical protein
VATKLDFDGQHRMRSAFFHLAVGKVRGRATPAAAARVAARQASFAVTTPTAIATLSGTTVDASFDPATGQAIFLVTGGIAVVRDAASGQMVRLDGRTGPQMTTIAPAATGMLPAPPSAVPAGGPDAAPEAQQKAAQLMAEAQPAGEVASGVLAAPTVAALAADVVEVQLIQAPPAPSSAPGGGLLGSPPVVSAPVVVISPAPASSVPRNISRH